MRQLSLANFDIKHYFQTIARVKTWQLIIIALLLMIVSATFLRLNNLGMVERRTAVLKADEQGDRETTQTALVNLQHYISSHMNTKMNGGIYLSKTYERDRDVALAAASNTSNPNSGVYQQASVECQARWQGGVGSFRNDYVQCVIDRVSALSPANDPAASVALPKVDNYRYDFSSPVLSFDLAGLFVILTGVVMLIVIARIISAIALSLIVKRRYQSL